MDTPNIKRGHWSSHIIIYIYVNCIVIINYFSTPIQTMYNEIFIESQNKHTQC